MLTLSLVLQRLNFTHTCTHTHLLRILLALVRYGIANTHKIHRNIESHLITHVTYTLAPELMMIAHKNNLTSEPDKISQMKMEKCELNICLLASSRVSV